MHKQLLSGVLISLLLVSLSGCGGVLNSTKQTNLTSQKDAVDQVNKNVIEVQNTLDFIEKTAFEDFNSKIVNGDQVIGVLETYKNKRVAILIDKKALPDTPSNNVITIDNVEYINYNMLLDNKSRFALNRGVYTLSGTTPTDPLNFQPLKSLDSKKLFDSKLIVHTNDVIGIVFELK